MAIISISEAARLTGKGRSTIQRKLKSGELSKVAQGDGSPGVDTSELIRVFGELTQGRDSDALQLGASPDTTALQARIAALESENGHLRERVADKDAHLEDMRQSLRLLEHKGTGRRWWPF